MFLTQDKKTALASIIINIRRVAYMDKLLYSVEDAAADSVEEAF